MEYLKLDFDTGKREQVNWEAIRKLLNGKCKKLLTPEQFNDPNACKFLRDHLIKTKQQLFWSRGYGNKAYRHPVNSFVAIGTRNLIPFAKQERIHFTDAKRVYLNLGPRTKEQKAKDRRIATQTKSLTNRKVTT